MNRVEIWKDVRGYTGLYQVSNLGRVKSFKRFGTKGGILKQAIVMGYKVLLLYKQGVGKMYKVHRLVGFAFVKGYKKGLEINHKKGNKLDNRAWMLEWTTKSKNSLHAFKLGLKTVAKGENCNLSKLTLKEVLKIRKLILTKSQTEIAKIYKVSQSCISHIINNKNWKT